MRCVRCEFENIPGQARCIRCGSVLEAQGVAVEVHPPRMAGWRRPLRAMVRWLRGHRVSPGKLPTRGLERAFDAIMDSTAGLLLSVVPGLAHLVRGRFKEVRLYVALWLLCLALGLFLYGSLPGSLLIGLAIGLHAWIAIQYGVFREVGDLAARVGTVLIVVACLTAVYWLIPRIAAPWLTGGHTTLTIPALNVRSGDYLLTRRFFHKDRRLPRGTLVLFRPSAFRYGHLDTVGRSRAVIGQIAGLPGETIRIQDGLYTAGQQRLDPSRFPVPQWLRRYGLRFETQVPPDSYFVSTEYTGNARAQAALIGQACIVPASEIRGSAFMCWWPLQRRGFIE